MTVTKMYCDHCGVELNDMVDYTCIDLEIAREEIQTDLCKDCYEKLVKTVKDFCKKKEA